MSENIQKDHYNQNVCDASSSQKCVKRYNCNKSFTSLSESNVHKQKYNGRKRLLQW